MERKFGALEFELEKLSISVFPAGSNAVSIMKGSTSMGFSIEEINGLVKETGAKLTAAYINDLLSNV